MFNLIYSYNMLYSLRQCALRIDESEISYVRTYVHIYVCMYVYVHTYVCVCECMYLCVCVCVSVCVCVYVCVCLYMHIHTPTHTHFFGCTMIEIRSVNEIERFLVFSPELWNASSFRKLCNFQSARRRIKSIKSVIISEREKLLLPPTVNVCIILQDEATW